MSFIHIKFGRFLGKYATDMAAIGAALHLIKGSLAIDHTDKHNIGTVIDHISTIGERVAATAAELAKTEGAFDPVTTGAVAVADIVSAIVNHQSFKDALAKTVTDALATVAIVAVPVDAGKAGAPATDTGAA